MFIFDWFLAKKINTLRMAKSTMSSFVRYGEAGGVAKFWRFQHVFLFIKSNFDVPDNQLAMKTLMSHQKSILQNQCVYTPPTLSHLERFPTHLRGRHLLFKLYKFLVFLCYGGSRLNEFIQNCWQNLKGTFSLILHW